MLKILVDLWFDFLGSLALRFSYSCRPFCEIVTSERCDFYGPTVSSWGALAVSRGMSSSFVSLLPEKLANTWASLGLLLPGPGQDPTAMKILLAEASIWRQVALS